MAQIMIEGFDFLKQSIQRANQEKKIQDAADQALIDLDTIVNRTTFTAAQEVAAIKTEARILIKIITFLKSKTL